MTKIRPTEPTSRYFIVLYGRERHIDDMGNQTLYQGIVEMTTGRTVERSIFNDPTDQRRFVRGAAAELQTRPEYIYAIGLVPTDTNTGNLLHKVTWPPTQPVLIPLLSSEIANAR